MIKRLADLRPRPCCSSLAEARTRRRGGNEDARRWRPVRRPAAGGPADRGRWPAGELRLRLCPRESEGRRRRHQDAREGARFPRRPGAQGRARHPSCWPRDWQKVDEAKLLAVMTRDAKRHRRARHRGLGGSPIADPAETCRCHPLVRLRRTAPEPRFSRPGAASPGAAGCAHRPTLALSGLSFGALRQRAPGPQVKIGFGGKSQTPWGKIRGWERAGAARFDARRSIPAPRDRKGVRTK